MLIHQFSSRRTAYIRRATKVYGFIMKAEKINLFFAYMVLNVGNKKYFEKKITCPSYGLKKQL